MSGCAIIGKVFLILFMVLTGYLNRKHILWLSIWESYSLLYKYFQKRSKLKEPPPKKTLKTKTNSQPQNENRQPKAKLKALAVEFTGHSVGRQWGTALARWIHSDAIALEKTSSGKRKRLWSIERTSMCTKCFKCCTADPAGSGKFHLLIILSFPDPWHCLIPSAMKLTG